MSPEPSKTGTQSGFVTPERFARVRAIFEAAIERPVAERRTFVEGACVGDPAMLREIEAMLAADDVRTTPSSAAEEGRFPAGTVLAGRYRILGLLGHGGMGEVYKAFDLILNQTVALKFLAPNYFNEAALVRFRNEVRIARQVSHPNVCRVYDLGMVEGLHFLSMEYIDGEDLASLLRRIGRLPQDKAIEFTRKICAGLSAAHERGVLHRDLKPANIMIDGRGHVRITDFGLAGLAAEIPLSDLRSGTPAYMSPEQKAGKEVTTRSDIYSLGLVLHEMFTGKARHETQSSPTELVKDLDPTVERLILRCLEEDPKRRPSSALNVAMALPGADPIAAALAAGETPSPEMVAASEEKEGLSTRSAVLCFAGVLLALILVPFVREGRGLTSLAPLAIPPDGLAFRAQEVLKRFGYMQVPQRTSYGFQCCDASYLRYLNGRESINRNQILASHQPAVFRFWYRQHRAEFRPEISFLDGGSITPSNPPNIEPGMIAMALDPTGRLVALDVRPWEIETPKAAPISWTALFEAAGLDPARFHAVTPAAIPPMTNDSRMAWEGTYAAGRTERIRLEAAFWQGRPVYFNTVGDWPGQETGVQLRERSAPATIIAMGLFFVMVSGAAVVAWRNLQLGRGDRRGAARVAAVTFIGVTAQWLLTTPHVADPSEIGSLVYALSFATFGSAFFWCVYMAIEPYVRRHWPDALISWTRLLAGRVRNPLVGSHVLAGITVDLAIAVPWWFAFFALNLNSAPSTSLRALNSVTGSAVNLFQFALTGAGFGTAFILMVVLLRLLLRRIWIADVLGSILFGMILTTGAIDGPSELFGRIYFAFSGYVHLWVLRRFGLLAVVVGYAAEFVIVGQPWGWGTWYANRGMVTLVLIAGVSAWALWVIISQQKKPSTESAT